jgi:hypothetical protein
MLINDVCPNYSIRSLEIALYVILSSSEGSDFSDFSDEREILHPSTSSGFRMTRGKYVKGMV